MLDSEDGRPPKKLITPAVSIKSRESECVSMAGQAVKIKSNFPETFSEFS